MKRLGTDQRLKLKVRDILGLSTDEAAGIDNANNPSASNPFATLNDIVATKDIVDITYAALVALLQSSETGAVPGQYYRITDYRTVHYMMDYILWENGFKAPKAIETDINTGDLEPLIVLATSENTLSPLAYSELYPNDIIHYDWNPDNWLEDISFGGNAGITIITGFKGVIYFRHDTLRDNYLPYDFRKVKFRRWNDGSVVGDDWKSEYQAWSSEADGVDSGSDEDYIDVLTFNCPGGEEQYNSEVRSVHIDGFKDSTSNAYATGSILSNNVFHLEADFGWYQVLNISIPLLNGFNTFNGYNDCIQTGSYFVHNKIGQSFVDNTIGTAFAYNIVGGNSSGNTFDDYIIQNTFGYGFIDNVVEPHCYKSIIGDNFRRNKIGISFGGCNDAPWSRPNTIGNNVHDCIFGSSLWYSTIGDYCHSITIGNECQHIDIGDNCFNIEIGNGSSYISIGVSDSGSDSDSDTEETGCHDISIGQGCGSSLANAIEIGILCNDIIIGSQCNKLSIGFSCGDIKFGTSCNDIVLGEKSWNNIFDNANYSLVLPAFAAYNEFKGIGDVDFTESDIIQIQGHVVHYFDSNWNVYQTYIDASDSVPEMVVTTKTIGIYEY